MSSTSVRIYTDSRRYGKIVTVVEGIDDNDIDLDDLAKKLKNKCAAGGTAKGRQDRAPGRPQEEGQGIPGRDGLQDRGQMSPSMDKRDFMRQEFIGLEVEVVASGHPGYRMRGVVVDETKNTHLHRSRR